MTDAPLTPPPAPAAPDTYPGKTLGIVGIVLAFLFSLAGIVVSAIALKQSKDAGYKNTPAKVGLILSIVFFVLSIIIFIAIAAGSAALVSGVIAETCQGLESGTVLEGTDGSTFTCP